MVARRKPPIAPEGVPPVEEPLPAPKVEPPLPVALKEDAFTVYETALRLYGPLSIFVKRTSGSPATFMVDGSPMNGAELYAALKRFHGQSPEAEYELKFHAGGEMRCSTEVTLPHMPNNPPYAQQPAAQQPPAVWQPPPQPPAWPQQSPQPQYAQQQQPPQPPAQAMNWEGLQALQKQLGDFLLAARGTTPAAPPPPAPALPPSPLPAAPAPAPPAVPTGASPADIFQAMRQQLELLQEMQRMAAGSQQPAPVQPVQQPAVQSPPVQQPPQVQTPAGMIRTDIGFVSAEQLLRAITNDTRPPPDRPASRFYYDRDREPPSAHQPLDGYRTPPAPQPLPKEKTPMEVMREALGLSKAIVDMADQIRPPAAAPVASEPMEPDDDSPVKVVDLGGAKGVFNKDDGSTRFMESVLANIPGVFKAAGDAWEAMRKARAEQDARRQVQHQLPPGYVEVGPGYVPPEGFTAVAVGVPAPVQAQPVQAMPVQAAPAPVRAAQPVQVLPDPPAQMPAPLVEEQPQQTWTPPSFVPGGQ